MLNWIVWNRADFCIKMDLALKNLQRLLCHKNQPTNQKHKYISSPSSYKQTVKHIGLFSIGMATTQE